MTGKMYDSEKELFRDMYDLISSDDDYRHILILLDEKGDCAHADLFANAFREYLEEKGYGVAHVTFKQTKDERMAACLEDRDFCFFDIYEKYYSSKHLSRMSGLIDDCMAGRKTHFRAKFESKYGHEGYGPKYFIFQTNDLDRLWFISCFSREFVSIADVSKFPETYGHWNITPQYIEKKIKEIES